MRLKNALIVVNDMDRAIRFYDPDGMLDAQMNLHGDIFQGQSMQRMNQSEQKLLQS